MTITDGVTLRWLSPQMSAALTVINNVFVDAAKKLVVVPTNDRRAVGIGLSDINDELWPFLVDELREHLGIEFDVRQDGDKIEVLWHPRCRFCR